MQKTRIRNEEDGLFLSELEHWELLESRSIYIYYQSNKFTTHATIVIPLDIVRHLKLKHHDKIDVAIRRSKTK